MSDNHLEKFNDNLKENNFLDAFKAVIADAIQLEILTVVEETASAGQPTNNDIKAVQGTPGKRIYTKIGLLEGDIKNVIGESFLKDESYKELRKFHEQQVSKGQEIINTNLQTLEKALNTLIDIYKKDPKTQDSTSS